MLFYSTHYLNIKRASRKAESLTTVEAFCLPDNSFLSPQASLSKFGMTQVTHEK
jgi:hypothetical protein